MVQNLKLQLDIINFTKNIICLKCVRRAKVLYFWYNLHSMLSESGSTYNACEYLKKGVSLNLFSFKTEAFEIKFKHTIDFKI
jgi:hypothetical protein